AGAGLGIAGSGIVTLIEGFADDRVRPRADACLAGVALGAGVAVVAGRAVGRVRVGAGAARRIADAGNVTLIEGRADDRVRSRADARLAGVALRAGIAVGAGATVRLVRVGAGAARRIAGAGIVTLIEGRAHDGVFAPTNTRPAGVGLGAGIAV